MDNVVPLFGGFFNFFQQLLNRYTEGGLIYVSHPSTKIINFPG